LINYLLKSCLLGLTLLLLTTPAVAQPPFTGQTAGGPVISPYLGLVGNDFNSGVSNYFTLVLPQIQAQQALQRQQGQIGQLQRQERANVLAGNRASNPIQSPQIRSTGHPTSFNNFSHYYAIQPGRRQ
jgi:hypothetical protein